LQIAATEPVTADLAKPRRVVMFGSSAGAIGPELDLVLQRSFSIADTLNYRADSIQRQSDRRIGRRK
jgi:hypothetical protein